MDTYRAEASSLVRAPAETVYAILADYREGHPRILPRPPFQSLDVETGGVGAGTVVRFEMKAFGRQYEFRARVETPEPGRILVETDLNTGAVTTFTVEPVDGGRHSRVTIATEGKVRGGLAGALERLMTRRFLRQTYARELKLLADLAEAQAAPGGGR